MISLNIEKTLGFISKEMFSPTKPKSRLHRKHWKTEPVKATTF